MVATFGSSQPGAYFQFLIARYGLALDNWSVRRLASLAG